MIWEKEKNSEVGNTNWIISILLRYSILSLSYFTFWSSILIIFTNHTNNDQHDFGVECASTNTNGGATLAAGWGGRPSYPCAHDRSPDPNFFLIFGLRQDRDDSTFVWLTYLAVSLFDPLAQQQAKIPRERPTIYPFPQAQCNRPTNAAG